jgi:hypothetical protein
VTILSGLDYGLIGIYLLIAAAVVIVVEAVVAAMWTLRIARHSKALNEKLLSERANLEADLARLRMTLDEMKVLWEPYGRLFRWLQHPLVIALIQSLARRGAVR